MWLSKLFLRCIILTVLLLPSCYSMLQAADEPFASPSNWGGTGLMEIPTARVIREHSYRIGAGQISPFRYFYGAVSPLKGLEIDGRITEFLGTTFAQQKTSKDKAIDIKYQFLSEGKYRPALALGIMDPHGTRLFASQYIAANKQIYPFDFTLGFGNGKFGSKPLVDAQTENIKIEMFTNPNAWLKDSRFFWGIQFAPAGKFSLMVEHSLGDTSQMEYFNAPVKSHYNFGIRYKPTKKSEIDLTYQRGDQIGVNLSMAFDIGNPLIPIYDSVYKESTSERSNSIAARLTNALYHSGFSDISIELQNNELWIEAANERYFYHTKAVGIILKIINDISPEDVSIIHIMLKENGIPLFELTTAMEDIIELHKEKLTVSEFIYLSRFNTEILRPHKDRGEHRNTLRYVFRPTIETFLNDPAGFFKYRFGLTGEVSYHPWNGASFVSAVSTYPLNNIETTNDPLSIPVRSDVVLYKKENIVLSRLMFDQIKRLTSELYGNFSAGLLEVQYAGIDAELAMPVLDGRILLGASGSAVKKRAPDNLFKLQDNGVKDGYTTAFFNARLNIPELGTALDIKAGRFLAGDNGVRVTISKTINGVKLWAWYSATDTSIFSDSYNDGYHDKGIGVSIPLRLFSGKDSRTSYTYMISPWTRDTGQDIEHFTSLFEFIGRNTKIFIDRDTKKMY